METSGSGPMWSAKITKVGKAYLKLADGPNAPVPRSSMSGSSSQQLVDDLVAAGGSLLFRQKDYYSRKDGSPDYERRVKIAQRKGLAPRGEKVVIRSEKGEWRSSLADVAPGTPLDFVPVPLPGSVARYHSIVASFRDRGEQRTVSRTQMKRVSRMLQGLVLEAERRGFTVSLPIESSERFQRSKLSRLSDAHAFVAVKGVAFEFTLREEGVETEVVGDWPPYRNNGRVVVVDKEATGCVTLSVQRQGSRYGPLAKWSDGPRATLESMLPAALHQIHILAMDQLERQRVEAETKQRRRVEWEKAMDHAGELHAEHHRGVVLEAEVAAWRRSVEIRAYVDEMVCRFGEESETMRWVEWARTFADSVDPLSSGPKLPNPPDRVPASELQPFLDGWSAHGPESSRPVMR